jgi:Ferritin-like domain
VVGLSRRGFLVASAAVVLGGCGVDEAGNAPPTDAKVLTGLLDAEAAAGAAVIGSPAAELLVRQDARHLQRLAALAGVAAPESRSDGAVDLATGLARKQEAVFAYVAALPKLADPDARVAVMQILASEAEHLAALRQGAGDPAVPDAFAGFTEAR